METNVTDRISVKKRSITIGLGMAVAMAACSGGDLTGSESAPVDSVAPSTTAAVQASEDAAGVPFAEEAAEQLIELDELPQYAVAVLHASRVDGVLMMTPANGHTFELVTAPALDIGQQPEDADEIAGFALLGDGRVVNGRVSADGVSTLVATQLDGTDTVIGPGSHPSIARDESLLVHIDGTELVGRSPLDWSEVFRHDVGPDLGEPELAPDAASAALSMGDDVVVVDLATGASTTIDRAAAVVMSSPTWRLDGELAVLQTLQHESGAAEADVVVVDVADSRVLDTIELPATVTYVDYDLSGNWLVMIDEDGALRWLGEGTTGLIDDDGYLTVDW